MSTLVSKAIPLTQIAYGFASITSSYTVAGNFTAPVVYLVFISTLNAAVQVSFDGVNDHVVIPAGNTTPVYFPIDFKTNLIVLPNPSISVKQVGSPSSGSLYVTAFSAVIP